jgi:hypothetical protein
MQDEYVHHFLFDKRCEFTTTVLYMNIFCLCLLTPLSLVKEVPLLLLLLFLLFRNQSTFLLLLLFFFCINYHLFIYILSLCTFF